MISHPTVFPRFLKAGTEPVSVFPRFLVDERTGFLNPQPGEIVCLPEVPVLSAITELCPSSPGGGSSGAKPKTILTCVTEC